MCQPSKTLQNNSATTEIARYGKMDFRAWQFATAWGDRQEGGNRVKNFPQHLMTFKWLCLNRRYPLAIKANPPFLEFLDDFPAINLHFVNFCRQFRSGDVPWNGVPWTGRWWCLGYNIGDTPIFLPVCLSQGRKVHGSILLDPKTNGFIAFDMV